MKWLASALFASVVLPSALHAKGLDKLQPDTEEPSDENEKDEAPTKPGKGEHDAAVEGKDGEALKGKEKDKIPEAEKLKDVGNGHKKAEIIKPPKEPEVPVEPGFQKFYLGGSLNAIGLKGPGGGSWHSSTTGEIEAGWRVLPLYLGKYDIYGTLRYRPADVTVDYNSRGYRGVAETYLVGAKAQALVAPKLFALVSAELGRSRASLLPVDGIAEVDGGLEKSGVDLNLGAGVSYLVLDKIALGAQLHLGFGTFKSTQFGVDLRFLL